MRIGLVFDFYISEYTERLLKGVQHACLEKHVELVVFSIGKLQDISGVYDYQNAAVASFISTKNLDGVIFISGMLMHALSKAEVASYIKSFKPLSIVNISMDIPGITSIIVDNQCAYEAILKELVERQKCSNFAILGTKGYSSEIKNRIKNIKTILDKLGIDDDNITILKSTLSYSDALADLRLIYQENNNKFDYDALICMNDEMAFAAIDFCAEAGINIPRDMVVLGFDNLRLSDCCNPTLSTIKQNLEGQGYLAGMNLIKEIEGKDVDKLSVVNAIPIMRDSTSRIPYDKKAAHAKSFVFEKENSENKFGQVTGTEWYMKKGEFYQTTKFYTEMQTDMTSEQLRARINDDIRSFGISACAVVLYEKPVETPTPFEYFHMPRSAYLYSAFDDRTGYDTKNDKEIKFNPKEQMLPGKIMEFDSEGVFVFAIYHTSLQYGYLVMRQGNYDCVVYDMFVKLLSSTIASVHSYSIAKKENRKVRAKIDELDIIARTDELTGLYNRRGLYNYGEATLKFAKTMNQTGMVIYCDMDGLKKINDTYGHEAGDRAILAESIILKGNFRSNDVIARVGGDEFVIICPGLTADALEKIRKHIDEDCQIWSQGNKLGFPISISIGALEYPTKKDGYKITPLLSEADSLMYAEKRTKKKK